MVTDLRAALMTALSRFGTPRLVDASTLSRDTPVLSHRSAGWMVTDLRAAHMTTPSIFGTSQHELTTGRHRWRWARVLHRGDVPYLQQQPLPAQKRSHGHVIGHVTHAIRGPIHPKTATPATPYRARRRENGAFGRCQAVAYSPTSIGGADPGNVPRRARERGDTRVSREALNIRLFRLV